MGEDRVDGGTGDGDHSCRSKKSVSVIRLGQIAYLAGRVAVTCGVEYRQRAGAKLVAITAFALPFLGGRREKHRAARLDVLDCT